MDERVTKVNIMKIDKIKNLSQELKSKLEFDCNLKKKNWFNIGGKSKVYFKPDSLQDLILFLKNIDKKDKIFILGAGSNTLITDNVYNGAIIKLGKSFSNISLLPNGIIIAGSAVTDKRLSEFALENEIGNFEFLSCIPGTIGGGLRMNAGCFNREFKDILVSVQALKRNGEIITIPIKDILLKYRENNLSEELIFLSASFKGIKKNKTKIYQEVEKLKKKKKETQPTKIKTSGSTFKNPVDFTDKKVWELIKESVSLDISFGDAYISKKHCNFFVNKGNATFNDMKKLINFVIDKVEKKTGIKLQTEIKILE
jgi:UDP-N-acetylmuramate dehydrogenase